MDETQTEEAVQEVLAAIQSAYSENNEPRKLFLSELTVEKLNNDTKLSSLNETDADNATFFETMTGIEIQEGPDVLVAMDYHEKESQYTLYQ